MLVQPFEVPLNLIIVVPHEADAEGIEGVVLLGVLGVSRKVIIGNDTGGETVVIGNCFRGYILVIFRIIGDTRDGACFFEAEAGVGVLSLHDTCYASIQPTG